ncbi:ABC transporter ATP-binding protein [Thermohalobacter berrensis]|uniref:Macrolide ABC transporter ATP-binding protein n=1 Tax=Thermohalobacter berrensis TaxID=99594 RepID=A0A419TAT9_9FIRM|nr:ABC transporter ATP-binding protein [Thermohalobacter berrensis]RKD34598.1 macrolide ABC transporter ATP-binding protein [Thermohalobacter berrensis]
MSLPLLKLVDITRSYKTGQIEVNALNGISLEVNDGEFISIMGPSGSGKSTLLNIIGCLDKPTSGSYEIAGKKVEKLRDWQLSDLRNDFIGFVFQNFHLLSHLNALENVELPLIYKGILGQKRKKMAQDALEAVGLAERFYHLPSQLSGGEQQRVAIARAIVTNPSVILADEPTGALDSHTSENIMNIFRRLNEEMGITIVQVTHEKNISEYGDKIYHLLDGRINEIEKVDRVIN